MLGNVIRKTLHLVLERATANAKIYNYVQSKNARSEAAKTSVSLVGLQNAGAEL